MLVIFWLVSAMISSLEVVDGDVCLTLSRVAKEEKHNRMTASSLAIVFAPCIMRSPDADDPFLGMKDVNKTTQ